jgi:hypothetical protein
MLAVGQRIPKKIKEDSRVTFDELQHETGLCFATIIALIYEDLKMKQVCDHWLPWNFELRTEAAAVAVTCDSR